MYVYKYISLLLQKHILINIILNGNKMAQCLKNTDFSQVFTIEILFIL